MIENLPEDIEKILKDETKNIADIVPNDDEELSDDEFEDMRSPFADEYVDALEEIEEEEPETFKQEYE